MAALAANRATASRNTGAIRSYPVVASDIIYAGSMVHVNSDGYAAPAAASASSTGVVGVAIEKVDNSSGSAGDLDVMVQEGEFLVAATSIAQTSVNLLVYASDDQTVDETQGTNEPIAGILTEVVSATSGWVLMGPGVRQA